MSDWSVSYSCQISESEYINMLLFKSKFYISITILSRIWKVELDHKKLSNKPTNNFLLYLLVLHSKCITTRLFGPIAYWSRGFVSDRLRLLIGWELALDLGLGHCHCFSSRTTSHNRTYRLNTADLQHALKTVIYDI